MAELSYAQVSALLKYDSETGELFWKERPRSMFASDHQFNWWKSKNLGKIAGSPNHGYVRVQIGRKKLGAHRLAWIVYYGEWPNGEIDHIDGDPSNNRIVNLRLVSHQDNGKNQKLPSNNTSGVIGVTWHKQHQKWCARIKVDGAYRHIGLFSDIEEAREARRRADVEHGFHANHGR